MALLAQPVERQVDRRRVGRVGVVQRALEEVRIEVHPVRVQRLPDALHDDPGGLGAQLLGGALGGVRDLLREHADVVALVAVLGHVLAARERAHGGAEPVDLAAGVVEVVLTRDGVARQLEHARERVAVRRVAGAGGRHRPGRVGGDVLDVDVELGLGLPLAPRVAGVQHAARGVDVPGVGEEDVEEAWPGDLDALARSSPRRSQTSRRAARRSRAAARRARARAASRRWSSSRRVRPSSGARAQPRVGRGLAVAEVAGGRLDGRAQLVDGVHPVHVRRAAALVVIRLVGQDLVRAVQLLQQDDARQHVRAASSVRTTACGSRPAARSRTPRRSRSTRPGRPGGVPRPSR